MKQRTSLSISVRRHFVDKFFFSKAAFFNPGVSIIDIGGSRKKRGLFNIEKYGANVTYVNMSPESEPDILADAKNIPLDSQSFNLAIMGELLEHVFNPIESLREAHRLLKPGGKLFATVPFNIGVHGDPDDYGRYTESYWQEAARLIGFQKVEAERQGGMFAVAALMVQHFFRSKKISWQPIQNLLVSCLMALDRKTAAPLLKAWTTGYGLIFYK